jgi:hypothetical protein
MELVLVGLFAALWLWGTWVRHNTRRQHSPHIGRSTAEKVIGPRLHKDRRRHHAPYGR